MQARCLAAASGDGGRGRPAAAPPPRRITRVWLAHPLRTFVNRKHTRSPRALARSGARSAHLTAPRRSLLHHAHGRTSYLHWHPRGCPSGGVRARHELRQDAQHRPERTAHRATRRRLPRHTTASVQALSATAAAREVVETNAAAGVRQIRDARDQYQRQTLHVCTRRAHVHRMKPA